MQNKMDKTVNYYDTAIKTTNKGANVPNNTFWGLFVAQWLVRTAVTNAKTWSTVRDSLGREDFIALLNNEKWIYYSIACPVEILVTHFCEEMHVDPEKGGLDTNISKDVRYHHLKMGTRAYFARQYIRGIILSLENKDTKTWDDEQNDMIGFAKNDPTYFAKKRKSGENKKPWTKNDIFNFAKGGKYTDENKKTPPTWMDPTNYDVLKLWKQMDERKRETLPQPNLSILCILYALFLVETNDKNKLKKYFDSLPGNKTSDKDNTPLDFRNIHYGITLREFILQKWEGKGPNVKFAYKKKKGRQKKPQTGQTGPARKKQKTDTFVDWIVGVFNKKAVGVPTTHMRELIKMINDHAYGKGRSVHQGLDGNLVVREEVAPVAEIGTAVVTNKEEGTPDGLAGV
jgi:hypothetical protein